MSDTLDKAKEIVEQKKQQEALGSTRPLGGSLGIQGLEEEDASILPIPFVRVVQGQSKDVKTKDGKEAPEGSFFFGDTREAVSELTFVILKSKVVTTMFKDANTGADKPTAQRKVLGMTMDTKKVFLLTLATTSFSRYGRLIAEMKQNKVSAVWDYMVTATTEKTENEKGKFWVVNFALGDVLNQEDQQEMGLAFEEYKRVLEDKGVEDNKESGMPF